MCIPFSTLFDFDYLNFIEELKEDNKKNERKSLELKIILCEINCNDAFIGICLSTGKETVLIAGI